jgi:hypothetical protein
VVADATAVDRDVLLDRLAVQQQLLAGWRGGAGVAAHPGPDRRDLSQPTSRQPTLRSLAAYDH